VLHACIGYGLSWVAEVTYLTWTADGLLRHVVYEGLREDKSPRDVRRTG
jgi:bifunctional non-homologous end joining protein LigD